MYLGHHVNISSGFDTCASYAADNKANCYQIFLRSPKIFNTKYDKPDTQMAQLGADNKKLGMKMVVHASYLLNFCNPTDSSIHLKAIDLLTTDLNASVLLNAEGVVVHMGKNVKALKLTDKEARDNYIAGIEKCLELSNKESTILFETGAGQGTEICTSIIELGNLRRLINKKYQHRIGFCIDTCHIFAAGHDIGSLKMQEIIIRQIDKCLGWKNVKCIHLNDSKGPLGCKVDRHADIGAGCIDEEALLTFTKYCLEKGIIVVLETPCDTQKNGKQYHYTDQINHIKEVLKI